MRQIGFAAGACTVTGTMLPWVSTGDRTRNSFDLAVAARRLDIASPGFEHILVLLWPVAPGLVLVSCLWCIWRANGWSRFAVIVVAAYVWGISVLVWSSPLVTRIGTSVTAVGASVLVVAAVAPPLRPHVPELRVGRRVDTMDGSATP